MKATSLVVLFLYAGRAGAAGIGVTETWRAAQRHDPTFAVARTQWEAGHTHVAQARALWLPTLAAQGSAGRRDQETLASGAAFSAPGFGSTTGVDFQTSVNGGSVRQWAFVAEQPVFDAERFAGYKEQRNVAAVADVQLLQARQELLLRSSRVYFAVLNCRAQLDALRLLHATAERARAAAQARYDAGDIPATDMREAQASADAIGVQELDAQSALTLSEAAYTDLTGLEPGSLRSLPGNEPAESHQGETLELWTQRVLSGNPQLAMQRLAVATASARAGRYGLLNSPRVSVVAQIGRESLRGSGDFGAADVTGRQASIVLQASIPLFTGGMRSAQRNEARALERKADAELEEAELHARQQARTAWLSLTTAAARVRALQRLHASSQDRLGATRLGVEIGDRTVLELLGAEADFLRSGTDLLSAQTELRMAELQLQASAGGLAESDLERIDQQLVDAGSL